MVRTRYARRGSLIGERLMGKVDKRGPDECWPWLGATDRDGYGMLAIRKDGRKSTRGAHRIAYEQAYGPIPDGLRILHECDNPPCCNPAHLRVGTDADNSADRDRKGRLGDRKGALNGHAKLTEDQVIGIMARVLTGRETTTEVARDLGVHRTQVQRIMRGTAWAHLFKAG